MESLISRLRSAKGPDRDLDAEICDHPIIFSAPMIRALLDGRKTQTRRLAWREPRDPSTHKIADSYQRPSPWQKVKPGDRLYVRENFQLLSFGDYVPTTGRPCDIRYAATDPLADCDKDVRGYPWRPCIHMPRWASRLTLVVAAAKAEPLIEISWDDALAEGIERPLSGTYTAGDGFASWSDPRVAFEELWKSLHGQYSWGENPEVVALTFTVHKVNIDQMDERQDGKGR